MTDEELKELVANTSRSVAELRASDTEWRASMAELRATQKETERLIQVLAHGAEQRQQADELRQQKAEQQMEKIRREQAETARVIRETGHQIGGLGNKFGSFTEGLALPSMEQVLDEEFDVLRAIPRAKGELNGEVLEIDVLAYGKTPDAPAYVIEVKSHLTSASIKQILKTIAALPKFFPEHAQRPVYGILVAVDSSESVHNEALNKGLYLARASGGMFNLQVPPDFKPQAFSPSKHNGRAANGQARRKSRK